MFDRNIFKRTYYAQVVESDQGLSAVMPPLMFIRAAKSTWFFSKLKRNLRKCITALGVTLRIWKCIGKTKTVWSSTRKNTAWNSSFRSDLGTNGVFDFSDNSILRTRDLSEDESFRRGPLLLWGSFHLEDFRFRAKRLWKKKMGGVREICGRSDGGGSNFFGQDGITREYWQKYRHMIQFVCSMMLVLDFKVKLNGLFFKNSVRVSPEETSWVRAIHSQE